MKADNLLKKENECLICRCIKDELQLPKIFTELIGFRNLPTDKLNQLKEIATLKFTRECSNSYFHTIKQCPQCKSFFFCKADEIFCDANEECHFCKKKPHLSISYKRISIKELNKYLTETFDNPKFYEDESLLPFPINGPIKLSYNEHSNFVSSLVGLPGNEFISSSEDGRMIIFGYENKIIKEVQDTAEAVNFIFLTNDKKYLLSSSDDCTVKVWDTHSWEVVRTLTGHTDYISKVCAFKSKLIISVSKDKTVRVWDFNSGECRNILKGNKSWVYCLAVSPNGKKAITSSINRTMIVWNLKTGEKIATLVDGEHLASLESLPKEFYCSINDPMIRHSECTQFILWLDNGKIITACKDIFIWNDRSFKEIKRLKGYEWKIRYLATFKKNKYLVSVAKCIRIWDLDTGKEIASLIGHNGFDIYSVAVSLDEKYLITGDRFGKIIVWNLNAIANDK